MYDLEDLAKPLNSVWSQILEEDAPIGFILAIGFFTLCVMIGIVLSIFFHFSSYSFAYTADQCLSVFFSLATLILFYPITFTIIYTPIALLLAIPVVLYKHVFKLG